MSLSVLAWHSSVCDDSELLDVDTGLKKQDLSLVNILWIKVSQGGRVT